jgi:hypothetical protein
VTGAGVRTARVVGVVVPTLATAAVAGRRTARLELPTRSTDPLAKGITETT